VFGQGVKCRFGRLVFTLGYDSGHTLLCLESGSGLYQEGSIFRGHLGPWQKKVPFLLMFGGNLCSKGSPGKRSKHTILRWSGKWYFRCLPLKYSRRVWNTVWVPSFRNHQLPMRAVSGGSKRMVCRALY